ncbi:hypothetical protein ACFW5I_18005 [Streptomyces sp. NPDC058818]|uniref:hypothetical protein n=1 Tax=Streptomyces sp. NPDC058818 TaxID=3346640 RepID=UPI0036759DF2
MDVLLCTACGHRLTEPLRLLPEVPPHPEYDGLKNPDGSRHAPPTLPPGRYAVVPEPSGAPYVPHPDPEWEGATLPGVSVGEPDGPRTMVSRGPRGTLVVNPEDARERLSGNPDAQESGCCGALGMEGPNQVCGGCGAAVATWHSECYGPWEIRFLPEAVRVASA